VLVFIDLPAAQRIFVRKSEIEWVVGWCQSYTEEETSQSRLDTYTWVEIDKSGDTDVVIGGGNGE
jgi:hypothetical protein